MFMSADTSNSQQQIVRPVTADNLLIGWTAVKVIPLSFTSSQREHKQTNGQLRTFSGMASFSIHLLDLDPGISGWE